LPSIVSHERCFEAVHFIDKLDGFPPTVIIQHGDAIVAWSGVEAAKFCRPGHPAT
jgi:uncharacterized protein YpiB (UPF0302 family)